MKEKGFTLIEMMAAIVVLVLIVTIAFPAIVGVIKRSSNKIDEATQNLIINGAKNYVEKNKNNFSLGSGDSEQYCVSIQTLIDNNFLISNLTTGTNDEPIDTSRGVTITVRKVTEGSIEKINYSYTILEESCS